MTFLWLKGDQKISHSENRRQTKAKILIVYSVNIINDAIIAEVPTYPMAKRMQANPQSIIKLKSGSKVET